MATIQDIAKATGYSTSTVSRALNNTGYCSPEAKAAIEEAARQLNYSPSSSARSLRSKRTNRILFVIPDILNPFYFEMIRGTTDVLDKHGLYSMLCYSKGEVEDELKFLRLLSEQFGDGMIMVSFDFNAANYEAITASRFPIVTTNLDPGASPDDRFDTVYVDHNKAMYLATEHLIQQGHREIAIVVGSLETQTSRERTQGYRRCLADYGIPFREDHIFCGDYTKLSGQVVGREILAAPTQYSGVVSANDLMSMGLMSAFSEEGVVIPRDISLVSLDNTDYAEAVHPNLTSVDLNQYAIGELAATLLVERLQDPERERVVKRLEPQLIVRNSSRELDGVRLTAPSGQKTRLASQADRARSASERSTLQ